MTDVERTQAFGQLLNEHTNRIANDTRYASNWYSYTSGYYQSLAESMFYFLPESAKVMFEDQMRKAGRG